MGVPQSSESMAHGETGLRGAWLRGAGQGRARQSNGRTAIIGAKGRGGAGQRLARHGRARRGAAGRGVALQSNGIILTSIAAQRRHHETR